MRPSGSSPRVRGTVLDRDAAGLVRRFIPACAGNSQNCGGGHNFKPVHPRVCGEQHFPERKVTIDRGSSPRVRGTGAVSGHDYGTRRFIPACAGNSRPAPSRRWCRTVHPRVCGEQPRRRRKKQGSSGSSPRVRGTVKGLVEIDPAVRFIPACAGNRPQSGATAFPRPVHPRVCGEQWLTAAPHLPVAGSSPRVRGTDWAGHARHDLPRFIPACAGNSGARYQVQSGSSVHPRVCGEQFEEASIGRYAGGSSPRVRGTGG